MTDATDLAFSIKVESDENDVIRQGGLVDTGPSVMTPYSNSSSDMFAINRRRHPRNTSDEAFKLSRHGMEHGLELRQKKEKQASMIYGMCSIIPKPRRR
ncbi:hypothetical protein Tco_0363460 [Tanacetum coccineum]